MAAVDGLLGLADNIRFEEISGKGIGKVYEVTLSRPEHLNALTKAMFMRLAAIFRALKVHPACRAVILTGEGRAFSGGVDLTAAGDVFSSDGDDIDNDLVAQMEACPAPIIGAINGHAVTAGFEISLACDILLASTTAVFIDTHCKFGIMPSWGLSQKLPRLIGANRARDASLSASPIPAGQALDWGLVSRVLPPEDLVKEARAVAARIGGMHAVVVRGYKQLINEGMGMTLAEGRAMERRRAFDYYKTFTPEDFARMRAFIEGRRGGGDKGGKPRAKL